MAEESTGFGSFVETTNMFSIENLDKIDINSPEFKGFLAKLRRTLNKISTVLNTKATGIYYPEEFVNGDIWFPNAALDSTTEQQPTPRQEFHKVITNFGTLPDTATKAVAHNISFPTPNTFHFVDYYGMAEDLTTGTYLKLPYSSPTLADNIEVKVDTTNVSITTGKNLVAYTVFCIVLRFIKE